MKALGYVFTSIIIGILLALYSGLFFIHIWAWFMIPIFGLPPLTVTNAAGLALVIGYLTVKAPKFEDDPDLAKMLTNAIFFGLTYPPTALFCAWILHLLSK